MTRHFSDVDFSKKGRRITLFGGSILTVTNRQQYLSWCKARALAILATGDRRAAIASMLRDVAEWDGDRLYDAGELAMKQVEATFYTSTSEEIRDWIHDFR